MAGCVAQRPISAALLTSCSRSEIKSKYYNLPASQKKHLFTTPQCRINIQYSLEMSAKAPKNPDPPKVDEKATMLEKIYEGE